MPAPCQLPRAYHEFTPLRSASHRPNGRLLTSSSVPVGYASGCVSGLLQAVGGVCPAALLIQHTTIGWLTTGSSVRTTNSTPRKQRVVKPSKRAVLPMCGHDCHTFSASRSNSDFFQRLPGPDTGLNASICRQPPTAGAVSATMMRRKNPCRDICCRAVVSMNAYTWDGRVGCAGVTRSLVRSVLFAIIS